MIRQWCRAEPANPATQYVVLVVLTLAQAAACFLQFAYLWLWLEIPGPAGSLLPIPFIASVPVAWVCSAATVALYTNQPVLQRFALLPLIGWWLMFGVLNLASADNDQWTPLSIRTLLLIFAAVMPFILWVTSQPPRSPKAASPQE